MQFVTRTKTALFFCYVSFASLSGGQPPELVMQPGTTITARTKVGQVSIKAEAGLKRSYTWEGATRVVTLLPRVERWQGGLGAYFPGPGEHWKEHHGITRGVLEEGVQHFDTEQQALVWIREQSEYYPTVFRDDGLVVSFDKVLERRQLNVEVWQILIGGRKPNKLAGSRNGAITVTM